MSEYQLIIHVVVIVIHLRNLLCLQPDCSTATGYPIACVRSRGPCIRCERIWTSKIWRKSGFFPGKINPSDKRLPNEGARLTHSIARRGTGASSGGRWRHDYAVKPVVHPFVRPHSPGSSALALTRHCFQTRLVIFAVDSSPPASGRPCFPHAGWPPTSTRCCPRCWRRTKPKRGSCTRATGNRQGLTLSMVRVTYRTRFEKKPPTLPTCESKTSTPGALLFTSTSKARVSGVLFFPGC